MSELKAEKKRTAKRETSLALRINIHPQKSVIDKNVQATLDSRQQE